MAKPINPTPMLEGKDKELFIRDINSLKYSQYKEDYLNECRNVYRKVMNK